MRLYRYGIGHNGVFVYHNTKYTQEEFNDVVVWALHAIVTAPGWTKTTEQGLVLEVAFWLQRHRGFQKRKQRPIQAHVVW